MKFLKARQKLPLSYQVATSEPTARNFGCKTSQQRAPSGLNNNKHSSSGGEKKVTKEPGIRPSSKLDHKRKCGDVGASSQDDTADEETSVIISDDVNRNITLEGDKENNSVPNRDQIHQMVSTGKVEKLKVTCVQRSPEKAGSQREATAKDTERMPPRSGKNSTRETDRNHLAAGSERHSNQIEGKVKDTDRMRWKSGKDAAGDTDRRQLAAGPERHSGDHSMPATVPGKPGDVPGKPGDVPGKPGDVPGKPGDVPGKPRTDMAKRDKGEPGHSIQRQNAKSVEETRMSRPISASHDRGTVGPENRPAGRHPMDSTSECSPSRHCDIGNAKSKSDHQKRNLHSNAVPVPRQSPQVSPYSEGSSCYSRESPYTQGHRREPRSRSPVHRYRSPPRYRSPTRHYNDDHYHGNSGRHWRSSSRSPPRRRYSRSPERGYYRSRSRSPRPRYRSRSPVHYRSRSPVLHHRSRSPVPHYRSRSRSPVPHYRSRSPVPHHRSRSPVPHQRSRSPIPYRSKSPVRQYNRDSGPHGYHNRSDWRAPAGTRSYEMEPYGGRSHPSGEKGCSIPTTAPHPAVSSIHPNPYPGHPIPAAPVTVYPHGGYPRESYPPPGHTAMEYHQDHHPALRVTAPGLDVSVRFPGMTEPDPPPPYQPYPPPPAFVPEVTAPTTAVNGACHSLTYFRADSRFAPSQWETALLCNDVSHCLGTRL